MAQVRRGIASYSGGPSDLALVNTDAGSDGLLINLATCAEGASTHVRCDAISKAGAGAGAGWHKSRAWYVGT